jgi:hypothetical protein
MNFEEFTVLYFKLPLDLIILISDYVKPHPASVNIVIVGENPIERNSSLNKLLKQFTRKSIGIFDRTFRACLVGPQTLGLGPSVYIIRNLLHVQLRTSLEIINMFRNPEITVICLCTWPTDLRPEIRGLVDNIILTENNSHRFLDKFDICYRELADFPN